MDVTFASGCNWHVLNHQVAGLRLSLSPITVSGKVCTPASYPAQKHHWLIHLKIYRAAFLDNILWLLRKKKSRKRYDPFITNLDKVLFKFVVLGRDNPRRSSRLSFFFNGESMCEGQVDISSLALLLYNPSPRWSLGAYGCSYVWRRR